MNELQAKMLEIFVEFKRVCEKHNLKYYLASGTALGAIRHGGFIPWDDDFDVAMPRKDYEKLMTLGHEFNKPFFLQNHKSDKSYTQGFAKLRNSDTTYIETFYRYHNINHGIWIDIFPIDGMTKRKHVKHSKGPKPYLLWLIFYFTFLGHFWAKPTKKTWFAQIPLYLVSIIFLPLNLFNWLTRAMQTWMKKISLEEATLVGSYLIFWTFNKESLPKEVYGDGVTVKFEGVDAVVPTHYHEYLTAKYGDYMKLPPENKQIGHHYATGVSTTIGYKDYIKGKR